MTGDGPIVRVEPVMGTVASFQVFAGDLGVGEAERAVEAACALLHRMDAIFSTWKAESPMSEVRAGRLELSHAPEEMAAALELCARAKQLTRGWFDPWAMPGGVDPTGLVKGWAAEEALAVISGAGAKAGIVNAGGDVAVFGEPPGGGRWRVGIRHPWRPQGLACVLEVDAALATSGCYERGAHLVDPRDGCPRSRAASASVTGPSLAFADAFATALAVAGDEVLELVGGIPGYHGYLIRPDGSEESTAGMVFAS